ncbi:uncharacterized protein LOC131008397 [Salvia miltiorrhiza]|uniref:uncharacterized protein LOC131008397 n=1 Tax=Salvia miltiorrhiza TaxID=226208 RepID=UPI0025ABC117|nr:uncharacterized protein LOC131008397 [Salvia miltiorrhiza]
MENYNYEFEAEIPEVDPLVGGCGRGRGRGRGRGQGRGCDRGRGGQGGGYDYENFVPPVIPDRTAAEKFRKEKPPTFDGMGGPEDAERWIRAVERIFHYINCEENEKVKCATYQLVDEADFWWESVKNTMTEEQLGELTWAEFKTKLFEKYIPECYRQRKQNEFWNLKQRNMTVSEYDRTFNQLSRYAPHLVDTDEKRTEKFCNGLRHEISIVLASQGRLTYGQTLNRALTIESLLPKEKAKAPAQFAHAPQSGQASHSDVGKGKRKWEERGNYEHGKRLWAGNQGRNFNQQQQAPQRRPCPRCNRVHQGECLGKVIVCYNCGEQGHYAHTCPKRNRRAPQQYNPGRPQRNFGNPPRNPGNQQQNPANQPRQN